MVRPQKYTDENLLELLRQTRSELTKDLSPYLLEKHTGVSKTVWQKRMIKEINMLNQTFNTPYNNSRNINPIPLDNVLAIYEKYRNNEKILLTKLKSYDIFVNNILKLASKVNLLESTLKQKENTSQDIIQQLEKKVVVLKKERDHFEKVYLETIGQSSFREQYRTKETKEPLSLNWKENKKLVDFIGKNEDLFD
ncbi:hypothetical protein BJG89_04820 [Staphylococcus nepalensis]|uniref:hypothetical protein n=1 Tax=Staphylococcus TaxID=1279 RepID=UPI000BC2DB50|nr:MULTISPECIES: hypothetical protein [Staphylococcus]ATH59645.1 hypothetical protein BJD96_04485 [Staphylococcus nepalensis]ATH64736.1 hypothetical protein BJG89_04820 [Staphylococcus nepalensis]NWN86678.1 hypothetical protein [Staphylococcus sp.]